MKNAACLDPHLPQPVHASVTTAQDICFRFCPAARYCLDTSLSRINNTLRPFCHHLLCSRWGDLAEAYPLVCHVRHTPDTLFGEFKLFFPSSSTHPCKFLQPVRPTFAVHVHPFILCTRWQVLSQASFLLFCHDASFMNLSFSA